MLDGFCGGLEQHSPAELTADALVLNVEQGTAEIPEGEESAR